MNEFYYANFNISKINTCVYVRKGNGQKIHKNRPFHGLVMRLNGSSRYIFGNGKAMEIQPNDVFYLPKFSDYRVESIVAGDCIAVNFELANQDITYPFFKLKPTDNKYKSDFESILQNWDIKNDGYMNLCYLHLYSIISNIQRDATKRYVASKQKTIASNSNDYIVKHIGDHALTIEKIAKHLGITPEYYRKVFREVYGCSPRRFIINMRMERAKDLLVLNEFSVAEISEMCGYDSESYFSSEFKRIVGCPPTEYV